MAFLGNTFSKKRIRESAFETDKVRRIHNGIVHKNDQNLYQIPFLGVLVPIWNVLFMGSNVSARYYFHFYLCSLLRILVWSIGDVMAFAKKILHRFSRKTAHSFNWNHFYSIESICFLFTLFLVRDNGTGIKVSNDTAESIVNCYEGCPTSLIKLTEFEQFVVMLRTTLM